jgi:hypothetical protein
LLMLVAIFASISTEEVTLLDKKMKESERVIFLK